MEITWKICFNSKISTSWIRDKFLTGERHGGDYHLRKKYDESIKKNILSFIKIPFFGYDFDEKYVKEYSSLEQKRYLIDSNKFLIYEKENINGKIIKNYYIEHNGKKELISEEKIRKLKEEYYEKSSSPRLLKDSSLNKVLSK